MSTVVALILWVAVAAYAVFGGADYGAGFWDLTSGGGKSGARARALINHTMAPVWEANNVWLIFALVVLWTGFPRAFGAITSALYLPLGLAALGIVLRGCGFAFREATQALRARRLFGALFTLSSLVTPFFLGASFGAIASGRVRADVTAVGPLDTWLGPTSLVIGVLAVSCAVFLAAVFLVFDARRTLDEPLERYFARRAIASGVVTGAARHRRPRHRARGRAVSVPRAHAPRPAAGRHVGRVRRRGHHAGFTRHDARRAGAGGRCRRLHAGGLGRRAVAVSSAHFADRWRTAPAHRGRWTGWSP